MDYYKILIEKYGHSIELEEYISLCSMNMYKTKDVEDMLEHHHILPKSIFPKYKSLNDFEWNGVYLTCLDHLEAHRLLSIIIGDNMIYAYNRMLWLVNKKCGDFEEEYLKTKIKMKEYSTNFMKSIGSNIEYSKKSAKTRKDSGYAHSLNTRSKMSKAHKGKKLTQSHKNRISKSLKGKPKTEEHNIKVSEANKGKKHSEESKIKMSKARVGKYLGDKNPSANIIEIYDNLDNLIVTCNGSFFNICEENNYPTKALMNSYKNNNKLYVKGKPKNKEYEKYKGWYAIKI